MIIVAISFLECLFWVRHYILFSSVGQFCLTLCDPMDYSPQGSSVNWILQAKILEWVAMPFSRDLPHPAIKPMLFMPPTFGRWVFTTTFCCLQSLQNQGLFLTVGSLNQFISVTQSCLNLCDPMDCSMPGLPVHHQLPDLAQTHVHPVSDAIQPSHPLLSPSPPALNLSQHWGLCQ